jgi:hypothetical protein
MTPYSIFKIQGDLYKVYDHDGEDWRAVTPTGERWFSKHSHLSLEESFMWVFNRIAKEYKTERYLLDAEFIK